jgi:hypothetical protein
MLGDHRRDLLRQVDHLAALDSGQRRSGQPGAASSAAPQLMRPHYVRPIGHLQRRARLALSS